jgi:hypothetical protein
MSYTNQKVSWEPCDPNKVPIDQSCQLKDVNNEYIVTDQNAVIVCSINSSLLCGDDAAIVSNYTIVGAGGQENLYGDDIMDIYGDICRPQEIEVLVRKQPHENVINTSDGRTLLTKSIFYADPRVEPNTMKIAKMDKLDGETVVQIYVMCDRYNKPKMVRFITV